MKLFANLLLWVSLVVGVVAAATAYTPRLEKIDPAEAVLTLAAGAGAQEADPTQPIVATGTALTADVVARLRDAGVSRVRVKEFASARWDGRWQFAIACVGLVIAAGMIRFADHRAVQEKLASARTATETPDYSLSAAVEDIDTLRADIEGMTDESEKLHAITHRLDELRRGHLDAFVLARAELLERLGLGGYAQLMDRFAAGERQLNRAWSAAVDHVLAESLECLERGEQCIIDAKARLDAGGGPRHPGAAG